MATTEAVGLISAVDALDRAYGGQLCELVHPDGSSRLFEVHRWMRSATATDLSLFVDQCRGRTLDVGCGPGRLTAALRARGVPALGIDISPEAVRQARRRGAAAACHDVFDDVPGFTGWRHIVLADGNIGLGGDPLRLLRRVAELLTADGSILVELVDGRSAFHQSLRLRVGHQLSPAFGWATVGVDMIDALTQAAGLRVSNLRRISGRPVATVCHSGHSSAADVLGAGRRRR